LDKVVVQTFKKVGLVLTEPLLCKT